MKALIFSLAMYFGLLTPPAPIVIDGVDPGGMVGTYILWYQRVAAAGNRVIIDGACISACTFISGLVPDDRICVTPRASFGIHAASGDKGKLDLEATWIIAHSIYPEWLQQWIKANGPLTLKIKYMPFEELAKHYRVCTQSDLPTA